jgi:hypothetical protein
MKSLRQLICSREVCLLAVGFFVGLLLNGVLGLLDEPEARAQQKNASKPDAAEAVPLDAQMLNERLPDQSHAMEDAGYHFANLWFAGTQQNWPLADYYLRKTQSYLELAVKIKPVRKTSAGTEVDLKGILDAVDGGLLPKMGKAIKDKDVTGFKDAYRQTVVGCIACHTASERSYLRVQVPAAPATTIIRFDPGTNATK